MKTTIFQIWVEYLEDGGSQYKELKPFLRGNTKRKDNLYYTVQLCSNGKYINFRVHRLVALHFIPNPNYYKIVDHIDGNQFNNKTSNLRWCTPKQNSNNPNSNVIRGVARYTLDGEFLDSKPSITSYVEEFGYNKTNIILCCQGKRKTAYGFKWVYLDKDGYLPY